MRKSSLGLIASTLALVGGMLTVAPGISPAQAADIPYSRLSGDNRFATAASIARAAYPNGAATVFIVNGLSYADSLSAGPAAAHTNGGAPILLVTPTSIPAETSAALDELNAVRIYIVGGTGSVSAAVEAQLAQIGQTTRIAGASRYETSRKVAEFAFPNAFEAYIATGESFADALAAGAAAGAAGNNSGYPLILVPGSAATLDAETYATLNQINVTIVDLVGGVNSVSAGIESDLESKSRYNVNRYAGDNRYETAIAVGSVNGYPDGSEVYLASGLSFPDALAGAAVAGKQGRPLYLAPGTCVTQPVIDRIGIVNNGQAATKIVLLGGTGTLSNAVGSLTLCS